MNPKKRQKNQKQKQNKNKNKTKQHKATQSKTTDTLRESTDTQTDTPKGKENPMRHSLEWSRAVTGRLTKQAVEKHQARATALTARLAQEVEAGELPFLSMPYREELDRDLGKLEPHLRRFDHMLLLGIGGSALGARALQRAFAPGQDGPGHTGPWLWIADNVCPVTFESWLGKLPPEKTVVVCISKSGGTIETLSQYFLVRAWLQKALGADWGKHMVVVTDKTKGFLRQEANTVGLTALDVPDYLGGRYSALSAVGMIPAAFLGMDWKGLLDGAKAVADPLVRDAKNLATHPSFSLAKWCYALEQAQYSQLIFFSYIPLWSTLGPWFAQLWAESLGKEGKGTMPLSATGVTDQHSIQQMFLDGPRDKGCLFLTTQSLPAGRIFPQDMPEEWSWLRGKPFGSLLDAEGLGTRMALCQTKTPLVHIRMGSVNEKAAGALMLLLEAATIFTGWLMDINPVDQPAVELGKRLANAKLGASGYQKEEADLAAYLNTAEEVQEF